MKKKLTASLCIALLLLQSVPALAHVGGPYSNNTHDGFQGGVFQGLVSLRNGSGMFRFSTSDAPFLSPIAQSVMFYKGYVYFGECFGMVDFPSGRVAGSTNGLSVPAGSTTGLGTPATLFNNDANRMVCNTMWEGKITSKAPSVRFKGKGFAYIFEQFHSNQTVTTIDTTGVHVDLPVPPGGAIDTTINQTIISTETPPMEKVKIRVRGGRVTPIAWTGLTAGFAPL